MQPILEVSRLKKIFKKNEAVKDVSFTVNRGICFGLLGPNGAGKTTTMEMVEDIIRPTSGKVLYKGLPRSNAFREEIGIQFQHTSLLNYLSVWETLVSFQKLFKNPEDLKELVERCNLNPILEKYNDKLSGGQLQRLMLALALINRPELVFLDEPSTGLDPQSRRNLWDIVEGIKNEGKTIIMTTHSMEEAEYLCDEIAIMDQGTIIAKGSPSQLINTYCSGDTIKLPKAALKMASKNLPFTCQERAETLEIETENIHECLNILLDMDVDLSQISVHSSNLEDVFLRLTGRQLRD